MARKVLIVFICFFHMAYLYAQFPLCVEGKVAPLIISSQDFKGVEIAAHNLQKDIAAVTGLRPLLITDSLPQAKHIVIIGTYNKNLWISSLIKQKKIDSTLICGKREKFITLTVQNPFKGIASALLIIGSEQRGTIYGIYDLSELIGVSPWTYWADVPVKKSTTLLISDSLRTDGEPAVEYRGMFINDEDPALGGWVRSKFGSFNHKFYMHVFELILRLKGNYLWPAMWGKAFYDDDSINGQWANDCGIVMGTSHHEPLGRAHDEWRRYGKGAWNYESNSEELNHFWEKGMQRMNNYEKVVTVGMRGNGDQPMSETSNIKLLERIVSNQRKIISSVSGKPAEQTPQVWALYKEVQTYYDKGMRVPDDITLLLCDDNWGNIRKLPNLNDPTRKGGYGMYYHYDYVGGPRNYKWINTNQIERVWEQMSLSYDYGVRKLWIVNVGDIKPMEYPIQFFFDLAWNPKSFTPDNLEQHTIHWAEQQFGTSHALQIAHFIALYTKYNSRCKPELLNQYTYNTLDDNEYVRVVDEYKQLATEAQAISDSLPESYKDAYYQLVLFPILASSNLYEMYYAISQNDSSAIAFYKRDSILCDYYNTKMSSGKWNHMMDQTHIGYTSWQQPAQNIMPQLKPKVIVHTSAYQKAKNTPRTSISLEASSYSEAVSKDSVYWKVIPNLGRTGSAITTFPTTAPHQKATPTSAHLEYLLNDVPQGDIEITIYLSPTLNFNNNQGLTFALGVDNSPPISINFNGHYDETLWNSWVAQNIIKVKQKIHINTQGTHTLKLYREDAGVVFQKITLNWGAETHDYL